MKTKNKNGERTSSTGRGKRKARVQICRASKVGLVVKNLPAKAGDLSLILGQKDPLEEGMATHSSTLAWRIPWTEEPGGLGSIGLQRVGHDRSDLARLH